jgi:hypothetical protein
MQTAPAHACGSRSQVPHYNSTISRENLEGHNIDRIEILIGNRLKTDKNDGRLCEISGKQTLGLSTFRRTASQNAEGEISNMEFLALNHRQIAQNDRQQRIWNRKRSPDINF